MSRMYIIRNLLYIGVALTLSACGTGLFSSEKNVPPVLETKPAICKSENLSMASQEIYFASNSIALNAEALETINEVAESVKQTKPAYVKIIGYADRSGEPDYNMKLSLRRANAVAKALRKQGIPAHLVHKESCGEESASVPTQDGVKIRENRRVVIQLQKK